MTKTGTFKSLQERGYYAVDYTLLEVESVSLQTLRDWLQRDEPKYTGWSPFWWPTRSDLVPKAISQTTYQCTFDESNSNTGHIERWKASVDGHFTIVRAHDLDEYYPEEKYINLVLPVWRIAELMLHAERMAHRFEARKIDFAIKFTGLKGRELTTRETSDRLLFDGHVAHTPTYDARLLLDADNVDAAVAEYTEKLLRPFYDLFGTFVLPGDLCAQEIKKMRSNRF